MKPVLYVANVDENGFNNNPLLARVEEYAKTEGAPVVDPYGLVGVPLG